MYHAQDMDMDENAENLATGLDALDEAEGH